MSADTPVPDVRELTERAIDTSTAEGQATWTALCMRAFENLPADTPVTFLDVDAILTWVLPVYADAVLAAVEPVIRQQERTATAIEIEDYLRTAGYFEYGGTRHVRDALAIARSHSTQPGEETNG